MFRNIYFITACLVVSSSSAWGFEDQATDLRWQKGNWKKDDTKLAKARRDIQALVNNKSRLEAIIAEERKALISSKPTSMSLFRWANAVLVRSRNDWDFWRQFENSREAKRPYHELFPKLADAESYEFTRTRFLFTTSFDFAHRAMAPLGERLLAKDPHDLSVMIRLLKVYQPAAFTDDRPKGERLVKSLDALAPGDLRVLLGTAMHFYKCWTKSKSKADAKNAILRFEAANKLSNSVQQRRQIEEVIQEIREG